MLVGMRRVIGGAAVRQLSSRSTVRASHNRLYDRRDTDFVLHELLKVHVAREDSDAILNSCESFSDAWHHVDPILDKHPPQMIPSTDGQTSTVQSHPLTKDWLDAYRAHGFSELASLGLPFAVQCAANYTLGASATSNLVGYFVLTRCAADLLEAHGSEALVEQDGYLAKLRSGEYFGTMALSEPHAGSSLSTIRTMATPHDGGGTAGEYRLRGDKMWTTGAFQDVSSNIVQMLLARTPDAKPGAGGISLFLVPNILPDGTPNDVELISLNKKMGHKALTNCAWSLGSREGGAVGYLVGGEGMGLSLMFGMMNAMRIEVGLGAACVGKRGYLEALLYAQERVQGGKAIIEHADVKRMLLQQKAYAEGAYALCMHAASLHEQAAGGDANAASLLDVSTEIVKSWPSEWCLEGNKLAIQVLGGAGYVADYPAEQLYRDNRLNMIHEGTAGIHALTLLGRKVQGGRAKPLFAAMLEAADEADALCAAGTDAEHTGQILREGAASLRRAVECAEEVTETLTALDDRNLALTNAHEYLTLMGHTCVAWMWLRSASAAARGLSVGADDADEEAFYRGKLHTCAFFFRHELPKAEASAALLLSLDVTVTEMEPGWF